MKWVLARSLLILLFPLAVGRAAAADSDRASIRGILVIASNEAGASDRALAPYEATLRRILRFESYRSVGQGSTNLSIPGEGRLSLGQGQHLLIEAMSQQDGQVRARVRWMQGGRQLMNTVLVLRRGVPAVLGGPALGDGEVYAVIVVAS